MFIDKSVRLLTEACQNITDFDGLVVVGFPHSDIGKGWLTATLGSMLKDRVLIKIDPLLETQVPVVIEEAKKDARMIHDDAVSYIKLGNDFSMAQEVLMGKFIKENFLEDCIGDGIAIGDVAKRTYSDIAYNLAKKIFSITNDCKKKFIIEVGGCPDDLETALIPCAIRHLRNLGKINIGIVILTKVENIYADHKFVLKTRTLTRAIETTMRSYFDLPLAGVYFRVAGEKHPLSDEEKTSVVRKVSFKTGIPSSRIFYIPEAEDLTELPKLLYNTLAC